MLRKHAGKARTELASQLQNCIFLTSTNHEPGFPSLSLWVPRGRGGAQISSVFASYLEATNFRPSRRYLQRQPTLKHLPFVHQTPYAKTIGPPYPPGTISIQTTFKRVMCHYSVHLMRSQKQYRELWLKKLNHAMDLLLDWRDPCTLVCCSKASLFLHLACNAVWHSSLCHFVVYT
jgi:hypothetical protein